MQNSGVSSRPLVNILWTGGLDSTYRVVQLSQFQVDIQPYYIIFQRPSKFIEIDRIKQISQILNNRPDTKSNILPLYTIKAEDIPPNPQITAAFNRLRHSFRIGTQYEWLARFAYELPGLELGLELSPSSKALYCMNHTGKLEEVADGLSGYYQIDINNSSSDLNLIFGNFHFPKPLFDMSKKQIKFALLNHGFAEIYRLTWFCHTPINNKPCGVCSPCQTVIHDGLGDRLSQTAHFHYHLNRYINKIDMIFPLKKLARIIRKPSQWRHYFELALIYHSLYHINPLRLIPDDKYLKWRYFRETGKPLDLSNPTEFCEKIHWLKLNYRKILINQCSDKVLVKEFIAERVGVQYCIPTLSVNEKPDSINWDALPDQIIIKCSHASSRNVNIYDNKNTEKVEIVDKLKRWQKSDWFWYGREWGYKSLQPKLIIEPLLSQDNSGFPLIDYKFYCFNGEPKFCQVIQENNQKKTADFFDTNWNRLPISGLQALPNSSDKINRPPKFEEMIWVATELSKDFPFVRVDLYCSNHQIYCGEMTFYPASGFGKFTPHEWNHRIGEMLVLPVLSNK